ncbi:MAG TPA: protein kinase [Trebonia sp.]|nr:protein kinase [Trebonia sp.]
MEPLSANDPHAVGEFQLRARLGAGGMGRVYLGFSPAGRAVAVKVVHPELARDAEFRQRFSREVAAARAVSGMYTAPVVAAGLDDDPPWLATAYVPGPSLADVVSRHGPLPEPAVWRLAAGLAEALRAVHACGLVHRDLKPANILLAGDGPYVIDFGISRAFEGTSVTAAGMVVGTPGYMSPEQAEGMPAGPASDVFSLGCVLAYAATGSAPFGGGSAASVLYRVVTGQPDLTGVAGTLREVISACLAKDPARRPDPAALGAMIAQAAPAVTATPASFWPQPLAELIRAFQAHPAQEGLARAGMPGPGQTATAQAQPGAGQQAQGQPGPGQQAQAHPGPGQQAQGQPGPARAPSGMVLDGYHAMATASMAAQRPATAASAAGPAQPVSWPPPAAAPPWPQPAAPGAMSRYAPAPQQRRQPAPVLAAAWLMCSGAAASLLGMIAAITTISRLKVAYLRNHPAADPVNASHLAIAGDLAVVLGSLLSIALWLWLAAACAKGRGWVRAAGTVLFGIDTLGFLATISRPGIPAIKSTHLMIWLIGLVTVIFLWRRQSSEYFARGR